VHDLLFSVNAVFPLLVMMGVGYGARRLHWVDENAAQKMNGCIFRIFLPCMLCLNQMDADRSASVDVRTLVFAFVATVTVFLLMFWLVPRLCRQEEARGVLIQGIARSNYAVFGIPLVLSMYPGRDTSVAVMMVVVVVPVYNILSTVALMIHGYERGHPVRILRGILLNPLILGTALGFLLWKLEVRLPELLDVPLRNIGRMATPLAQFVLGASLDFRRVKTSAGILTMSVAGRLVLVPLVGLTAAVLMGIRDVSLATLIAVFASPTAVSSYPMAQQMGGDEALAVNQVVFSTAFSTVTVFLWVLALKRLGFL